MVAKHGIENVKWQHVETLRGIRRARGNERSHRACLVDAFFEDLPVFALIIIKERLGIDRFIELALGRIDPDFAEQRVHAEGAGFVGDDRCDAMADFFVAQQQAEQPHEGHGRGNFHAAAAFEHVSELREGRNL